MSGKIVFFGTSKICLDYLKNLYTNFELCQIISSPDSIGGRHNKKIIPPVKQFALDYKIPLFQPVRLRSQAFKEQILELNADLGVVISYGKLIPRSIINAFKHKIINVHFSLLPKYRGAAPVQRAIQNNEKMTGVSIFEINTKMDAGDIYNQVKVPITPSDNSVSLFNKLCSTSQPVLLDTIRGIFNGSLIKKSQDHSKACHAAPIRKVEGLINWNDDGAVICNKFRAFTPWPSVFCLINTKPFKLTKIGLCKLKHNQSPGTILSIDRNSLKIGCGNNTVIEVIEFQASGKKPMTPYTYSLGNPFPKELN